MIDNESETLKNNSWDYYDEKVLKGLVVPFEFDFERISRFFKEKRNKNFTKENCQIKWKDMNAGCVKESPLQILCKKLPDERKEKNYLKISESDLKEKETVLENGSKVFPNGKLI